MWPHFLCGEFTVECLQSPVHGCRSYFPSVGVFHTKSVVQNRGAKVNDKVLMEKGTSMRKVSLQLLDLILNEKDKVVPASVVNPYIHAVPVNTGSLL